MNPKCAIRHPVFIVFPTEYQAFHQCLLKSHFLVYKKINLHLWHNNLRISLITVIIVFVCRFVYRCGPNINQIQVERRFHISCRCVCQLYLRAQLCINISSSKLSVSVNVMVYLSVSVYHHITKCDKTLVTIQIAQKTPLPSCGVLHQTEDSVQKTVCEGAKNVDQWLF